MRCYKNQMKKWDERSNVLVSLDGNGGMKKEEERQLDCEGGKKKEMRKKTMKNTI